jgi:iron complex outermembrane receptor protein
MSVGRAYRAPSLSELYGTIIFHGPIPGYPNPGLKPEYITAVDSGVLHDIGRAARVEANVFFNDMTDLITLHLADAGDHFDWINVSKARSAGTEVMTSVRPVDWLNTSAYYGYTWSRDDDTGSRLEEVPTNKVFLSADGSSAFGRLVVSSALTWRWYGDTFNNFRSVAATLPSHSRTDATVHAAWGARAKLGLSVQNLFNQTYQETAVNLAPARMFSVSLNVHF